MLISLRTLRIVVFLGFNNSTKQLYNVVLGLIKLYIFSFFFMQEEFSISYETVYVIFLSIQHNFDYSSLVKCFVNDNNIIEISLIFTQISCSEIFVNYNKT